MKRLVLILCVTQAVIAVLIWQGTANDEFWIAALMMATSLVSFTFAASNAASRDDSSLLGLWFKRKKLEQIKRIQELEKR